MEADRISKQRSPLKEPSKTPPKNLQDQSFQISHKRPGQAATSYRLTIKDLPVDKLSKTQIRQLVQMIEMLNRGRERPLQQIRFTPSIGGSYSSGKLYLPFEWGGDFQTLLGQTAHEMGHSIFQNISDTASQLWVNPQFVLLSGLSTFNNLGEMIDDSNYIKLDDNAGHLDSEGIDGSAVHAYTQSNQLLTYIRHKDTPAAMRLYGEAIYLFIKDEVFHGTTFCGDKSALLPDGRALTPILDRLVRTVQPQLKKAIAEGSLTQLKDLREPVMSIEVYDPKAGRPLRAQLVDRYLAIVTNGSAEDVESALSMLSDLHAAGEGLIAKLPDYAMPDLRAALDKRMADPSITKATSQRLQDYRAGLED